MSRRELRRVEVLARVQAEELKLTDAASLMGVSYRQAKRIGKRYREEGAEGMKHRSAGRRSSRAKPEKFRRQVLGLVRRKYSGEEGRRFGLSEGLQRCAGSNLPPPKLFCFFPSRASASSLGLSDAGGDLLWESERVKGAGEGTKGWML